MYKLTIEDNEFTIPKKNIRMFALYVALQRGETNGKIRDDKTAIEYLENIGIKVNEMEEKE